VKRWIRRGREAAARPKRIAEFKKLKSNRYRLSIFPKGCPPIQAVHSNDIHHCRIRRIIPGTVHFRSNHTRYE
jgi:hypothetical protein